VVVDGSRVVLVAERGYRGRVLCSLVGWHLGRSSGGDAQCAGADVTDKIISEIPTSARDVRADVPPKSIDPHAEFFTKDEITISVLHVYQSFANPDKLDQMALIGQLKKIAIEQGYNVSESTSNFTGTKYIHFKKFRIEAPKAPPPLALPAPDECIEVEEVRKAIKS
jgi:hypothetical protein